MLALVLAALLGAAAMQAKAKKGEQFFKLGQTAELKNDWDTAVTEYQKAVDADPANPAFEIAMRRARFQAGQKHVDAGVKLRNDNKLQEAMGEFQKALLTDPSSQVAIQEIKRTQQMLQGKGAASPGSAGLTPTEAMKKEEDQRVASIEAPPELKPSMLRLPNTKMNSSTPTNMFRTVATMAGLYVSFDPAGLASNKPMDVNMDEMTVEQALDYLAFVTHTFWKPISSNTIFVGRRQHPKAPRFPDRGWCACSICPTPAPCRNSRKSPTRMRTVAEIRRVFTYNAGRAMVVRGTPDEIAFVEKLVHDLDKPKAEVIVDVDDLETNSSYSKQLAATIASGGTAGLNMPDRVHADLQHRDDHRLDFDDHLDHDHHHADDTGTTGTATTGSSVALNSLAHLSTSDFSTSLPGALLNAMLTDTPDQGAESSAGARLRRDEGGAASGLAHPVRDRQFGLGRGRDHGGRESAGADAVLLRRYGRDADHPANGAFGG